MIGWTGSASPPDTTGLPGNWTQLHNRTQGGAGHGIRGIVTWWVGLNEPPAYTVPIASTIQDRVSMVLRITGYDGSAPINVSEVADLSSTPVVCPSATTDVNETLAVRMCVVDLASDNMLTGPGTVTILDEAPGKDLGYGAGYADGPNPAGASGTANFTHDGTGSFLHYVATTVCIAAGNSGAGGSEDPDPPPGGGGGGGGGGNLCDNLWSDDLVYQLTSDDGRFTLENNCTAPGSGPPDGPPDPPITSVPLGNLINPLLSNLIVVSGHGLP